MENSGESGRFDARNVNIWLERKDGRSLHVRSMSTLEIIVKKKMFK